MDDALPAWSLAASVTSFATLGAGLALVAMTALTQSQPLHWRRAYACLVLVGAATLGLHAHGEPAGGFAQRAWSAADTGTNLLLAFALLLATLRDFGPQVRRARIALGFGALNVAALLHVLAEKFLDGSSDSLHVAGFGALTLSQLVLVADYLAVITLFAAGRRQLPRRSRRLLPLLTALALVGVTLAMPDSERVDASVLAYHALWHMVSAFLLLLLWVVNELRFPAAADGGAR
jgi:hypothetical protein